MGTLAIVLPYLALYALKVVDRNVLFSAVIHRRTPLNTTKPIGKVIHVLLMARAGVEATSPHLTKPGACGIY